MWPIGTVKSRCARGRARLLPLARPSARRRRPGDRRRHRRRGEGTGRRGHPSHERAGSGTQDGGGQPVTSTARAQRPASRASRRSPNSTRACSPPSERRAARASGGVRAVRRRLRLADRDPWTARHASGPAADARGRGRPHRRRTRRRGAAGLPTPGAAVSRETRPPLRAVFHVEHRAAPTGHAKPPRRAASGLSGGLRRRHRSGAGRPGRTAPAGGAGAGVRSRLAAAAWRGASVYAGRPRRAPRAPNRATSSPEPSTPARRAPGGTTSSTSSADTGGTADPDAGGTRSDPPTPPSVTQGTSPPPDTDRAGRPLLCAQRDPPHGGPARLRPRPPSRGTGYLVVLPHKGGDPQRVDAYVVDPTCVTATHGPRESALASARTRGLTRSARRRRAARECLPRRIRWTG